MTAILLAAGVTIGAVIGEIDSNKQSVGKRAERNRQKKTASLLPVLLGSFVSFLFKAAGQAMGSLAEHTWLLILSVVDFLMESYIKKRR